MKTVDKQPGNTGRDGRGRFEGDNPRPFKTSRGGKTVGRPKIVTLSEAY